MNKFIKIKNGLLKIIQGDRFTPFSLAKKLGAKVLLESASFHKGKQRWSVLLVKKAFTVSQKGTKVFIKIDDKISPVQEDGKDILDVMSAIANQHQQTEYGFPVPSGGIGYLTYENAALFDKIIIDNDKPDSINIPQSTFIVGHLFLIFDHYTDTIFLLGLNYEEKKVNLKKLIMETELKINDFNFNFMNQSKKNYKATVVENKDDKKNYLDAICHIKKEITKGNLIQGVPSRRIYVKTKLPALEAYRNLRSINPSPYLFYLDFDNFQLFGSSPEVHVKVFQNKVDIRPIAGTRKRGKSFDEDNILKKELLSDEKEKAEHLMLVDLARNDIGRVCEPGTIKVTEFMSVEYYSHVMHIVSNVQGTLKKGKTGIDAIRATFPAGTVSGAPKIKAIQIVDSLEAEKRSFYAGVVGWIEPGGNLNTCITIRSALKMGDTLVLQAGGGIVFDSVPEDEFVETQNKLKALTLAIGLEV